MFEPALFPSSKDLEGGENGHVNTNVNGQNPAPGAKALSRFGGRKSRASWAAATITIVCFLAFC